MQSIGREGVNDISFTVSKQDTETAKDILEQYLEALGAKELVVNEDVTKVSIVGAGMVNNPGVAAEMFEALFSAGINIQMISTSEIKISVLIDSKDSTRAVAAIHDAFLADLPR